MVPSSRRSIIAGMLASVPVYALLAELALPSAVGTSINKSRHPVSRWISQQNEIANALADGSLSPSDWQDEVEALSQTVDVDELLAEITRAEGKALGRALPSYPAKRSIRFRDGTGRAHTLRYAAALFSFEAGNLITPHGHRNMVSAHTVVEGSFRVRTFDRLRDEPGFMIIRPHTDRLIARGDISTMSGERENVHWFVPTTEQAATFDVIVSGLEPGAASYRIDAVDPLRATSLPNGALRAPVIDFHESARRYTADL